MKRNLFILAVILLGLAAFLLMNKKHGFIQVIQKSGVSSTEAYGGASWGDYNSDGFLDLIVRKPEGLVLYKNNGNETFTDVSKEAGFISTGQSSSATFGDYDNDGCPDIFMTNGFSPDSGTPDVLYHNNCNGTFTDVSTKAGVTEHSHERGVAWGDYDKDGYLDIYVATFGILNFIKSDTAWILTGWNFEPNILYHNNHDGTFTNVAKTAGVQGLASCEKFKSFQSKPRAEMRNVDQGDQPGKGLKDNWQPVWFDYDNDGWPDMYVSHETTINVLYHNNHDGTFTDVTEKAGLCQMNSTHGVAIGDYNNDGNLDIFAAGSLRNIFWKNNGDGTFTEVSEDTGTANFGLLGWSPAFFDFNNDGFLDLYIVNGSTGNATWKNSYPNKSDNLFLNNGRGQFTDISETEGISGNDAKTFGVFGDFNNDGFVDAFILSDSEKNPKPALNRLYKNTPNGNHYLTVRLTGTESNSQGVGSRITLEANGEKQIREVISGGPLMSQNSIWPTFGVGSSTSVDSLTIHWPSGKVQTLHNIKADQVLSVKED